MNSTLHPISANGKKCVGPCYAANTVVVHPTTLKEITGNQSFCPVDKYVTTDQNGQLAYHVADKCFFPTHTKNNDNNLAIPDVSFYSDYFVKTYYNILSLEDAIDWLAKHIDSPYRTRERVFINSMIAFGDTLGVVDIRFAEFISIIMNKHIRFLYKKIRPYMQINDSSIKINAFETKHKPDNDNDMLLAYAYIQDKFLGIDNIITFLSNFIRNYKNNLTNENIVSLLTNQMGEYIIKNIK